MPRVLTSISMTVASNPIDWETSTSFLVIASYSDGTTRNITDSCTYSMDPGNIVVLNGIELWNGTDSWVGTSEW